MKASDQNKYFLIIYGGISSLARPYFCIYSWRECIFPMIRVGTVSITFSPILCTYNLVSFVVLFSNFCTTILRSVISIINHICILNYFHELHLQKLHDLNFNGHNLLNTHKAEENWAFQVLVFTGSFSLPDFHIWFSAKYYIKV